MAPTMHSSGTSRLLANLRPAAVAKLAKDVALGAGVARASKIRHDELEESSYSRWHTTRTHQAASMGLAGGCPPGRR
jgi:hypothetical protein